jgi:hypothetical protein
MLATVYLIQQQNRLSPQKYQNSLIILYEIQYLKYPVYRDRNTGAWHCLKKTRATRIPVSCEVPVVMN